MSSEREQPRGADGDGRSEAPEPTADVSAVDGGRRPDAARPLFDTHGPIRSVADRPQSVPRAVRPRSSPILGSGPETTRHRKPARSHHQPPFQATAPVELPAAPLERFVDGAYRWRTALGLALAGVMTTAIVVAYQSPGADDVQAVGDGAGAESRSAIAAVTEFDTEGPTEGSTGTTTRERLVGTEVEDAQPGAAPASPSRSSSTTTAPSPAQASTTATTVATTAPTTPDTTAQTTTTPPSTEAAEPASTDTTSETATTTTVADTMPSSTDATTPEGTATTSGSSTTVDSTSTTAPAPAPVRTEVEDGTLLGTARARSDHEGYSGAGFVGDLITEGSGVSLVVQAPGGPTPFQVRYSAGPDNGPAGPRTISVVVNGTSITEARMRLTPSWDDWDVVAGTIDLVAGENQIVLLWAPGDTGWVNIDYVELN